MTGEPSDGRTRKDERSWKEGNTGGNHISCLWPHLKRFLVLTVSYLKYSCFSGPCVPLLLPLPLPHLLACLRYRILLLRNLDNLYDLMTWWPEDLMTLETLVILMVSENFNMGSSFVWRNRCHNILLRRNWLSPYENLKNSRQEIYRNKHRKVFGKWSKGWILTLKFALKFLSDKEMCN